MYISVNNNSIFIFVVVMIIMIIIVFIMYIIVVVVVIIILFSVFKWAECSSCFPHLSFPCSLGNLASRKQSLQRCNKINKKNTWFRLSLFLLSNRNCSSVYEQSSCSVFRSPRVNASPEINSPRSSRVEMSEPSRNAVRTTLQLTCLLLGVSDSSLLSLYVLLLSFFSSDKRS